MSTFNHKGVEITLLSNGKFSAETPTGRITAASLDAIKKRLDKPAEFDPFPAFLITGWIEKEFNDISVFGVVKAKRNYRGDEWQTSDGARCFVYADTPENRAIAQVYIDTAVRIAEMRAALDKELHAAEQAIAVLRPGDQVPQS